MSANKLSVLHIHFWADIRNSAGSVEKVITAFASHGQKYRHLIACCAGNGQPLAPFVHHNVPVHPFRESALRNRLLNKTLRLNTYTCHNLITVIHRLRPAVLHFHNRQELVDAVAARLDYRPTVVVQHHRHFAEPTIPESADRLLFISRRTTDDILEKTRSRTPYSIVSNPLSIEVLARSQQTTGLHANPFPIILFGGGGSPIKGGKELLEAFASLPVAKARLILAGRNVEKLPGLPQFGVEVLGEVPATQSFDLMQRCDIVTMPSHDEPFGLIAQEAMLMKKLLVVSHTGGLAEFTDSDCAILVSPRDKSSLHEGLKHALQLLHSPEKHREMVDSAYSRAEGFLPQSTTADLERACDAARNPGNY